MRARLTAWAEEYDRNPEWVLADAAVGWLFRMHPANDDAPTVLAKVVTLDALYATNLGVRRGVRRGGLWHEVTHRIVGLKLAFDEALRAGDPAAVDLIRETTPTPGNRRSPDTGTSCDRRTWNLSPRWRRWTSTGFGGWTLSRVLLVPSSNVRMWS